MSRRLSLALRILPVAACVAWVLWDMDFHGLAGAMAALKPWGLLLTVALLAFDYIFMGLRLRVASAGAASWATGFGAALLGQGINNILPAKAGELAKVLYLRRKAGVGLGASLGIVFWERLADVNAMLCLGVAVAFVTGPGFVAWPLAVLAAVLWAGVALVRMAPGAAEALIRLLYFERLKRTARDVADHIQDRLSAGFLLRMALVTLAVWIMYYLQLYVMLRHAAGLDLSPGTCLVVFLATAGSLAVPSTPGGVGVYEAVTVAALALYGVPREQALAVALAYHALLYFLPLFSALWLMFRGGLSLRDVRAGAAGS